MTTDSQVIFEYIQQIKQSFDSESNIGRSVILGIIHGMAIIPSTRNYVYDACISNNFDFQDVRIIFSGLEIAAISKQN